jgi:hypothetical protein
MRWVTYQQRHDGQVVTDAGYLHDVELGGRVVGWMDAESAPWRDIESRAFTIRRHAHQAQHPSRVGARMARAS